MSLTLYLDERSWLRHFAETEERFPEFLPVIKGNGYGFGNVRLTQTALRMDKHVICVGTIEEARTIEQSFSTVQTMVLTPVLTSLTEADHSEGRIYTVGSFTHLSHLVSALDSLQGEAPFSAEDGPRKLSIVIKCQSPMKRYGFSLTQLDELHKTLKQWSEASNIQLEIAGLSVHFPQVGMSDEQKKTWFTEWISATKDWDVIPKDFYISHVSSPLFQQLKTRHPEYRFCMRLGTDLWLADKSFLSTKSMVLDTKPVQKGERFGYKQGKARKNGTLVFLSGGTANGVGLEAPSIARSWRDWLKLTAFWGLSMANRHLSPYTFRGRRTWFAEPPHMQTSVLFFPNGENYPEVGDELPVTVRMTTAHFDRCVVQEAEEEMAETARALP
ncbi:alanine racemase [Marininema halotolerans]|uniref:Alanine racemase, N-terminal domain n=1 Tax=Marininema halotolerans TaxID=1155944 RepID=A0A1I6UC69_9BACL|nr:alanine racemase [Marininema halotolerans]SFS99035.1 Alanine racemase, N-terminal domain [Marininema halotolerans]